MDVPLAHVEVLLGDVQEKLENARLTGMLQELGGTRREMKHIGALLGRGGRKSHVVGVVVMPNGFGHVGGQAPAIQNEGADFGMIESAVRLLERALTVDDGFGRLAENELELVLEE